MAVQGTLRGGDRVPGTSARKIPCGLGTCALGTVGQSYAFDPGQDVASVLGAGKLTQWVLYIHATTGSRAIAVPTTGVYPSITSSLTQSGSGPAITVAAASGSSGAADDFSFKLKIKVAGANGVAQADVYWDGSTIAERITIPDESPAVVRGTVNIASSVPAMDTLTLIFTDPGSTTITFASSPTTAQGLVDAFNALAIAAPLAVRARVAETTSGSFFELYTTAKGASAALTISASSTGEGTLGLATVTANGAAATWTPPFSGLKFTMAAGTYVLDESYTKTLAGPRSSVAQLSAAAVVAHDSYSAKPFGLLVTVEDFATNANAKTAQTTLTGLVNTWSADTAAPIYVDALTSTALHTASSTLATNDANIATNDADILAQFPATTPDSVLDSVAVDDVYIPGAAGLPLAIYRRPATWAGAAKVAGAARIASNAADGGIFGATLIGPDGTTRARDENRATTKLGQLSGPGFWAIKSTSAGLSAPAFEVCASRAGASSRLRDPGAVAIGREIQRLVFEQVEAWNGQGWEGNAARPVEAAAEETAPREHHLEQILGSVLRPSDYETTSASAVDAPNNVTAFDVVVTAPTLGNDGKVNVAVPFNPLNVVGLVVVNVTATGAKITSAG